MINYLKEIFKALNDAKINYAVLRGYETLPYKISHDIDFGVDVNDLKQMTEILVNVSDKFNYKKVYQSKRKGIVQFYFYYNNNCLKLDLWTDFSYKGLQYLDMDIVLRQIKIHNDIKVLNEETEVLISFLKEFLHNGWIRKDKLEILKEKLNKEGFFNSEKSKYVNNNDIEQFTSFIEDSKVSLKIESKKFIWQLVYKNIKIRGFAKTVFGIVDYLVKFAEDTFIENKSFFIVLIGPDGSGKTTLSQEFKKEIKNKTCCFSKYYYIHGRFGILPNLSALLGNKKENTQIMKFGIEDVKNVKPYNKLKISIYMSYYFFDFLFGYLKLFKLKFSNTLIVADRYFYDYFYQEHFQKYPKIFYYMFMQLLPKPDLVIFLKADAQEIYKRKPEISLERINVQQQNIQKLINDMDNSITVDSSMQVEETYREIKGQILNQASK